MSLLDYNPKSGHFTWKPRGESSFDSRYAGKRAGSRTDSGYIRITVDGETYLAHRLAVAFVTGRMPRKDRHVHHINHNREFNASHNVVECTPSENRTSTFSKGHGSSKMLGVNKCKQTGLWLSRIAKNGKTYFLGRFKSQAKAGYVRDTWAKKLHKDFATLNFS